MITNHKNNFIYFYLKKTETKNFPLKMFQFLVLWSTESESRRTIKIATLIALTLATPTTIVINIIIMKTTPTISIANIKIPSIYL